MFQIILFPVDDEKEAKKPELVPESVLAIIEEAYPNSRSLNAVPYSPCARTLVFSESRNLMCELTVLLRGGSEPGPW